MNESHLLECVGATPERADTIFRRYAGIPEHKSLAHTLRRQRGQVGKQLQRMAEREVIHRRIGDDEGHPVPVFWRKRPEQPDDEAPEPEPQDF